MSSVEVVVHNLVELAVEGRLDIPEFQRDFVWRPDQVSALADSLRRDYPIGQILTWDGGRDNPPRGAATVQGPTVWLVDGQQRVTALCLLFGRKPHWWGDSGSWQRRMAATNVLANVCCGMEEVEFGLANPIRLADPRWIPVREILARVPGPGHAQTEPELGEIARAIFSKLPPALAAHFPVETIESRIRQVRAIRDRPLLVSTIQHDLEDVAEIFTRLNQQGTEIVESDIGLAVAASLHPGWVRDQFLPFLRNLSESGYELPPGVVIRLVTALGRGRIRLKEVPREFWTGAEFDQAWAKTRDSLSAVVSELALAGILSSTLLPSRNALIPLAVLRSKYSGDGYHPAKSLHWFLMAARDGRYSGASVSALTEDISTILQSTSFAEALEALRDALEVDLKVSPDEFLERSTWNRPLVLVMYLAMVDRKARDLVSAARLAHPHADDVVEYGFEPYLHPFFPKGRSGLKNPKLDYTDDEIGATANLILLNDKPKDRRWLTGLPETYFASHAIPGRQLEEQLIPLDRSLWEIGRYRDFLSERSKLLAKAANDYLAHLLGSAR